MQNVKWGVLGTANIARGCTIPGMKLAENCELYAVAGRRLEKAEAFRKEFGFVKAYEGYDALLEDPEVQAVYIPLPNDLHLKWVTAALKKGKHVLCEKPLALNAEEAKEMYRTAEECGVILMEAYALSFAFKHILAVLRAITDLPDGKHNDELHILKWFFFCFAYPEPESSDISGYKIKVELFTEITYVLQIAVFLFTIKQNTVFSTTFTVSLIFRNNTNGGFNVGIQGSKHRICFLYFVKFIFTD